MTLLEWKAWYSITREKGRQLSPQLQKLRISTIGECKNRDIVQITQPLLFKLLLLHYPKNSTLLIQKSLKTFEAMAFKKNLFFKSKNIG